MHLSGNLPISKKNPTSRQVASSEPGNPGFREFGNLVRNGDFVYGLEPTQNRARKAVGKKTYKIQDFINEVVGNGKYYGAGFLDKEKQEFRNLLKYIEETGEYNLYDSKPYQKLIGRICKGGISYIIKNAREKIHFFTKDVDVEKVFRKKGFSYTGSELRKLYRLWLMNPKEVDQAVIMYDQENKPLIVSRFFQSLPCLQKEKCYQPKFHEKKPGGSSSSSSKNRLNLLA